MAKKVLGITVGGEVVSIEQVNEQAAPTKLTPVTADFGRADLNELRDKLNELIARS